MLTEVVSHIPNVKVTSFSGLLVEHAKAVNANIIVRGLRAITDFEYELQMAQTNRILQPEIDTIFFTTNIAYSYLSSSTVKEIARYGGDISNFVTNSVAVRMKDKLKNI